MVNRFISWCGPVKAHDICGTAAALVSGNRASTHGDKWTNHANIAALWSAYLEVRITPLDAALMMGLLKIARTKTGTHNNDDYIDLAGYAGCAGEIAERIKGEPAKEIEGEGA